MLYINGDNDTTKHPNSEPGDIDKTIKLSFQKLAPGSCKKVLEHIEKIECVFSTQICAIPPTRLNADISYVELFESGQLLFVNDTVN